MKNKKKLSIFLLFTFVVGCMLTGCTEFDASRYVQSCLDASFHGEFETYMEMTNSSEADARASYDQLIQTEVNALEQGFTISDEQKEKFKALFIDMYKACKYEVGEATKNDDKSFTVPVTTYKLTVFDGMDAAADDFATSYYDEHSDASVDEIYAAILDFMYDYISEKVANPEYGDAVTTNVSVPLTSTNPKIYTLDTNDLQNLVYELLDVENQ